MTKHRTHSKLNIPFCAGLVLLCLTLFSMHLTSGLYARYVTSDSAEDAARVAKFDVVISEDIDKQLEAICGATENDMEYSVVVRNNSEVVVDYELDVEYTILIDGDDITSAVSSEFSDDGKGTLSSNGGEATHLLTFEVDDWELITSNFENGEGQLTFNFLVKVNVEQVD